MRAFYAGLEGSVGVGIEASGQSQWFERMLAELGPEVWIGNAAKIRASCERKQKTDRRDAKLLLRLLAEDRFPRIWVPTAAERDARQLLLHGHKLVRMRTQGKNQLQALALNQGVQRKWKLWSEAGRKQLESLPLLPWASRRRAELLQLDQLEASIAELDRAVARFRTCSLRGKVISSRKDELVRSVVTWVGLIIAIVGTFLLLIILGDKPFGIQILSLVGDTEWRCQREPG